MSRVLVVDLDNTLSKIDILAEMTTQELLKRPISLVGGVIGTSNILEFKEKVAAGRSIRAESLPLNQEVLDLIEQRKSEGWKIVLATASVESVAKPISDSLEVFDEVIWSSQENLKGATKAARLEEMFGAGGFDYVGDSHADKMVWPSARERIYAGPSRRKFRSLSKDIPDLRDLGVRAERWAGLRAMRPSHWVKNLLVFLPLFLLGDLGVITPERILDLSLLFAAMSCAASGLYLINDILDTESDRSHPDKSKRSIAAGHLAAFDALLLSLVLMILAGITAWVAGGPSLVGLVAGYAFGSYLYSSILKKLPLIDIVFLTLLYLSRIFIGAWLVGIPVSFWLAVFAFFAFLSLASIKRLVELRMADNEGHQAELGLQSSRGYVPSDIKIVQPLGIAFAVASQLVLALYIHATFGNQGEVALAPMSLLLLWTVWMFNIWLDYARGRMDSDPVKHALKSKQSLVLLALIALAFAVSKSI